MLPQRVWSVIFRHVPFINPLKLRNSMKIDEDFGLFLEVYHCFAFLAELKLNRQDGRDNNRGHQKQN